VILFAKGCGNVVWNGNARNQTRNVWSEGESTLSYDMPDALSSRIDKLHELYHQCLLLLLIVLTYSKGWKNEFVPSVQECEPRTLGLHSHAWVNTHCATDARLNQVQTSETDYIRLLYFTTCYDS